MMTPLKNDPRIGLKANQNLFYFTQVSESGSEQTGRKKPAVAGKNMANNHKC